MKALQPNYNLYDRVDFESQYAPICAQERLGVITYYSLAGGFLTGKYRSAADATNNPSRGGKVKGYFDARGLRILKALDEVAARHAATPAQVSLAWLIARPGVTAPIASATSLKQLGGDPESADAQAQRYGHCRARRGERLAHDPEKREPVFGKDHAQKDATD